ncbi:flavodoxin-dependent (E)-4-hydroxy-3-methylbut-2-enyl-diphosphate synthase [Clostridium sp. UBA7503]|uniref:flavodoxin-dependent (E)-4-hydroxy-3-methylbut-2-enyl-diphosphate synthase n=1 Tax=Clostridium sp. UBA7503 TaxID=1946377 RepID=UPI0032176F68
MERRTTRKIRVGDVFIGGDAPITIQAMTYSDTRDIKATIDQIKRLEVAGCEIVRVAIVDQEAADAIKKIKKEIRIPLVADIHYDYRLALACIENGVDKIRINPGNIADKLELKKLVEFAKIKEVPIRIGINSGCMEKEILKKYNGITADGMVESVLNYCNIFETFNFENIVIAVKSSSVPMSIDAYRKISKMTDYPLHIGVTETGTSYKGTIKSTLGIGTLLAEGIGDTVRVSLTGDLIEQVTVAKEILKGLEIRKEGIQLVSCPTCGRCKVNSIEVAKAVDAKISSINKNLKVAIMGCSVNGPGEARDADIGIAGGDGEFLLFKKGKIIRKISKDNAVKELVEEIERL